MSKNTNNKQITNKEFEDLLKSISDIYTPEEIEEIRNAYMLMRSSDKRKARLIRPIVPIEEWIEDPYFVGPDVENLYPFWKKELIKIFSSPVRVNQLVLTGAIGIGKTTVASLAIIRKLYELSCYENISALFNLFGVSRIAFAYLSVTREQAMNTGFALLLEWIDSIPYFREHFKRKQGLDSMLIWPQERLLVTFGSVANHFIGMNLFGSILDEANYFEGRSKDDADFGMNNKVSELYTQIVTRSQSRFIVNGENHSFSIVVSSSTVNSSFTNQIIESSKNDPHTVVISPALWDVKPWNYKGEKFLVFAGGDNLDPQIINTLDELNAILQIRGYMPIEHNISPIEAYNLVPADIQSRLIKVPVEHKQAFQTDIIIALQDLAGYSVSSANRLFSSYSAYERCLDDSLKHPFSRNEIVLSTTQVVTQEGYLPIKSYLNNGFTFKNKNMLRYMHLDLALAKDCVGISMCHISGWKNIYKQHTEDGRMDEDGNYLVDDEIKIPIITFDFMLRIKPPKKPNKISFGKIRDFIVYLRNEHKIKFGMISTDQYQSAQLMQELSELGFPTSTLSVDRTAEPYLAFTNLIYEERVNFYDYEPFKRELFSVIYYPSKNKVDHPHNGSKDVSDSVVGSAFNAIRSIDKTDIREQSLLDLFILANSDEHTPEDAKEQALSNLTDILLRL